MLFSLKMKIESVGLKRIRCKGATENSLFLYKEILEFRDSLQDEVLEIIKENLIDQDTNAK